MDISYCDIKKNLRKISEIAKESDTSLENVLLYLIADKLDNLYNSFGVDDISNSLDEIKGSLGTIADTLEDMKSEE